MRITKMMILVLLLGSWATGAAAGVLLQPVTAQPWDISEWINSDPGTLTSNKGKVVLIDFFQLWCPGCNSFSIPLFKEWEEKYGGRDDIRFVSIHTVFEGHDLQTPDHLRAFVVEKGITHPVGIDKFAKPGDEVPITMDRYKTGGTPHVVIIGKGGKVRFSHFGVFDREPVESFIDRLLVETGSTKKRKTLRKGAGRDKR